MSKRTNYGKTKKNDTTEKEVINVNETLLNFEVETPDVFVGTVSHCKKLNVRSKPSVDAEVLTIINEGEEITIVRYENESEDFYQVKTKNNIEGYCMKKYITFR